VRLAPKCDRAGPAIARFYVELGLIDESGHPSILPIDGRPTRRLP
jgi:hypothetical protein